MSELNPYEQQASKSVQEFIQEIALLKLRIAELEAENKALRLIAGSHSMSELRRLREQYSYGNALQQAFDKSNKRFKYPPAEAK